jgi:peptidoglycan-N-acetylglucosamine deacetylase
MRAIELPPLSGGAGPPNAGTRSLRERLRRHAMRFAGHNALGTITHVATNAPVAALTFDDGPDPVGTPAFLDILERHGAKATFFMLGIHARRHTELVRRIAQAGHGVANHSLDHPRFPTLPRRDRIAQIKACEAAIAPFGCKLFRPPRGLQSIGSRIDALLLGYQVVTWSVIVQDWEEHTPEWFADRLDADVKPGSIVLLHDILYGADQPGAVDRTAVLAGLDMYLTRNRSRLSFITVPELIGCGQPHNAGWFVRSDADWAFHDPS